MKLAHPSFTLDPKASAVLAELHGRSQRQLPSLIFYFLWRSIPRWLLGQRTIAMDERAQSFLSDKLIALAQDKCELCHLLCRALGATRIVEVGTSFGVSTIYLAAAARENTGSAARKPIVVGTEIDPRKVAAARQNLEQAGLGGYVDIRQGDARETLRDLDGPIDFVLLDSWIPLARPMIEMLAPRLRPGAVVICDNTVQFSEQYRDYLTFVRTPANGFHSTQMPYRGGIELSVRSRGAEPWHPADA